MISFALCVRSERFFSRMKIRPLLPPLTEGPPAPMADMNAATLVLAATIFAACCWCAFIASKEIPCAPSVMQKIWLVSSSGKKPLGITTNKAAVAANVVNAMPSVTR